jgi:hypothetical protein
MSPVPSLPRALPRAPPRRRAWRWALLAGALAALLTPVLLVLLARTEPVRALVLEEVRERVEGRLGEVTLGDTLRVGWRGQVELGPLTVAAATPGAPPVLRVERLTAWPRLRSLARGRVELATLSLEGVAVEAGEDGRELRTLLSRLQRAGDRRRPSSAAGGAGGRVLPRVTAEDVSLAATHEGRRYALAPFAGELRSRTLDGGALRVSGRGSLPGGGEVEVELERAARTGTGTGTGGTPLPTGRLAVRGSSLETLLGPLQLPVEVHGGELTLEVHLEGERAQLSAHVAGLTVSHPRLAEEPVGPLHAWLEGPLVFEREARRVKAEALTVALGPDREARATLSGHVALGGGDAGTAGAAGGGTGGGRGPKAKAEAEAAEGSFALALVVDALPYQAAVDALPPALRTGPDAERLEGVFSARLALQGPLAERDAWRLTGALDLSGLKRAARENPPFSLVSSFTYTPRPSEAATGRPVRVGPDNPRYTPLEQVPYVLRRAVLLSEDISFYSHRGFDFEAIQKNLFTPKEHGPVRGGSTLSQQLAKNLFLTREKTFARKVREALYTLALEGSLSKDRMLEIYFNIIEWGPNIYGLGEASWHYFGRAPAELSVKQAVFLATIIPGPLRYHGYCSRGAVTPLWEGRMAALLHKLHGYGDIDLPALDAALAETLVFVHGGRGPEAATAPVDEG